MVSVLFTMPDSHYLQIPDCDCYDAERDALTFAGGSPVVAHPPCRGWGKLARMSHATPEELELGIWAIAQVRQFGGVLEHPIGSRLLGRCACPPVGGYPDQWGGYTIQVDQFHWGHRCQKRTLLYIVGVPIEDLPQQPFRQGEPTHCIDSNKSHKPEVGKRERMATPPEFGRWLVEIASKANAGMSRLSAPSHGYQSEDSP